MEFFGNRLTDDQVKTIVEAYMEIRYGDLELEPSQEDIRFALKHYLKRMLEEPEIFVHQNDHGEWVWDIVEGELEDEAFYEHLN
ncbi:hypothetical protein [Ammoniphilus sp. CFH 90114]|uniref:hypothetical protein n=1 Tax=Ammoniphilus sp. CFH 90114 TaxID=2493665 RepID=UPI00100F3BD2|nr:hypothetical protein [Ammoniphilus sp. CFH 90114]RXT08973.1 hypothetical protein EIZ39_09335 [Ammoniphilus sp. CFH 90114]